MWRPVTAEELQLYVDGQIDRTRINSVEAYLEANPGEAQRIADYCRQNELLHALAHSIDDEMPAAGEARLRALVARHFTRQRRRLRRGAAALALLAAAGLGAAGGTMWRDQARPAATAPGLPAVAERPAIPHPSSIDVRRP